MARYLVEAYVPRAQVHGVGGSESRVLDASRELTGEGRAVSVIRTTCIPDDDTCFYAVEADSIEIVRKLCGLAGLESARVVEAKEHIAER